MRSTEPEYSRCLLEEQVMFRYEYTAPLLDGKNNLLTFISA